MGVFVLANARVAIAIAIVLVVGMAMCVQGGIGRAAEANQWTHPLAIVALMGAKVVVTVVHSLLG